MVRASFRYPEQKVIIHHSISHKYFPTCTFLIAFSIWEVLIRECEVVNWLKNQFSMLFSSENIVDPLVQTTSYQQIKGNRIPIDHPVPLNSAHLLPQQLDFYTRTSTENPGGTTHQ